MNKTTPDKEKYEELLILARNTGGREPTATDTEFYEALDNLLASQKADTIALIEGITVGVNIENRDGSKTELISKDALLSILRKER